MFLKFKLFLLLKISDDKGNVSRIIDSYEVSVFFFRRRIFNSTITVYRRVKNNNNINNNEKNRKNKEHFLVNCSNDSVEFLGEP